MQHVDLNVVRYAAMVLVTADENGIIVGCEYALPEGGVCGEPAEYLVPDATRAGGGGQDIEQRPVMFCGERLEEMLGYPPAEQPIFGRIQGPEQGDE